jgi:hypothetical protein
MSAPLLDAPRLAGIGDETTQDGSHQAEEDDLERIANLNPVYILTFRTPPSGLNRMG